MAPRNHWLRAPATWKHFDCELPQLGKLSDTGKSFCVQVNTTPVNAASEVVQCLISACFIRSRISINLRSIRNCIYNRHLPSFDRVYIHMRQGVHATLDRENAPKVPQGLQLLHLWEEAQDG